MTKYHPNEKIYIMISGTLQLLPTPCNKQIKSYDFSVDYELNENEVKLTYNIDEQLFRFFKNEKPSDSSIGRKDRLWEKNCLEFFIKPNHRHSSYLEFNFSIERKWNVFHFNGYRKGKKEAENIYLKKIESHQLNEKTIAKLAAEFTLKPKYQLDFPLFHGSAISYIDNKPCYFHNLPKSQRPPDFHRFHGA